MQKLNKQGTELVLLALHGVRKRLSKEKFNSYCELSYDSADRSDTPVSEETREDYWNWWQRDPVAFFSHVKNLREYLLLEVTQWTSEF